MKAGTGAIGEWWPPFARIIAFGSFDLDDVSTEVAENLSRKRRRDAATELDDQQSLQRALLMH